MPLLAGQPFVPNELDKRVPDSHLVYYNAITGEAFVDYESFVQQQTLYSSMLWTCEITGRSGLTFVEAVTSEREAASVLDSISPAVQRGILFLLHHFEDRLSQMDAISAIVQFVSNRFFIGETVTVLEAGKPSGTIVGIVPPAVDQVKPDQYSVQYGIDSNLYSYLVIEDGMDDDSEPKIVFNDRVVRSFTLTKDKLRLFLKTSGVVSKRGQILIPPPIIEQFELPDLDWSDIFGGPFPDFNDPTKQVRSHPKVKPPPVKPERVSEPKPVRLTPEEREKLREEARNRRNELKRLQRLKVKQAKDAQMAAENEWKKKRDDLNCDDLKPLPPPTPVNSKIPLDLFGDAIAIMEFLNLYNPLLEIKEFFPEGITLPLLVDVLYDTRVDGVFGDVIKVLLTTNLALMNEDEQYFLTAINPTSVLPPLEPGSGDVEQVEKEHEHEGVEFGKKNYLHVLETHGVPLKELQIDEFSLSEVVRLHILTAGAFPRQRCVQRAWYDPWEDPLLILRSEHPEILNLLEEKTIFDLNCDQRVKLIHGFINQLLMFITARDHIDSNFQELMRIKKEIREKTFAAKKNPNETPVNDTQLYSSLRQMQASYNGRAIGRDRAYRRYYLPFSLDVLLVDHSDVVGVCLEPLPIPIPVNPPKPENGIPTENGETTATEAENLDEETKKTEDPSPINEPVEESPPLGIFDKCARDPSLCAVHGESEKEKKTPWGFYHTKDQIDSLIESLNPRGFRESVTREYLILHKDDIIEKLGKSSHLSILNQEVGTAASGVTNGVGETKKSRIAKLSAEENLYEILSKRLNVSDRNELIDALLLMAQKSVITGTLVPQLGRWEDSVKKCTNLSQLYLHLCTLERSSSLEKGNNKRKAKRIEEEIKDEISKKKSKPISTINFKVCDDLVKKLSKSEHSWPFRKKPQEKDAPNYSKCVKRYVDLGLLVSRLNDGTYRSNEDLIRDVLLMFTNCELYWPHHSLVAKAGRNLRIYFHELIEERKGFTINKALL